MLTNWLPIVIQIYPSDKVSGYGVCDIIRSSFNNIPKENFDFKHKTDSNYNLLGPGVQYNGHFNGALSPDVPYIGHNSIFIISITLIFKYS